MRVAMASLGPSISRQGRHADSRMQETGPVSERTGIHGNVLWLAWKPFYGEQEPDCRRDVAGMRTYIRYCVPRFQ